MSSRALRKLQRDQEQQKQLRFVRDDSLEGQEEDGLEVHAPAPRALNAFEMLNGNEEDHDDQDGDAKLLSEPEDSDDAAHSSHSKPETLVTSSTKKSKKKKNKKKPKLTGPKDQGKEASVTGGKSPELDEIDLALKSLSTKPQVDPTTATRAHIDEANLHLHRLLAVESRHLNALNEMKRLFGSVVLENEDDPTATLRQRSRGPRQLDLGGALAGRNSPVSRGQGLVGLALRRNPFILGKEEWPKATSGGLGMELVEKLEDETIEYRFVHNTIYQDVQRQFETCVESMNPQRMIQLLQFNPYHISTLLQVSEIAKQQGDHSVSGDLLERALFSFGRSVHSSFTNALAEGKARLDFRRPENREFWLAAWRYIHNLGQRGTWRTAYEWAKLILGLDPEGDPYCVGLNIDQIALRGGQAEHFLELSRCSFYDSDLWRHKPNIRITSALAEYKLKHAQASRASLSSCIQHYPWIFARLFQSLNIDHIPKSIWGKSSRTERESFDTELYIHNAKDLWNTPEAISLLMEVAESTMCPEAARISSDSITIDEARHVVTSGIPALINLIPRDYTSMSTSSSDPLPPSDNLPSYDFGPSTDSHPVFQGPFEVPGGFDDIDDDVGTPVIHSPVDEERDVGEAQETRGLQSFFRRFVPWLAVNQGSNTLDGTIESTERRASEVGTAPETAIESGDQLLELHGRPEESLQDSGLRETDAGAGSQDHEERTAYADAPRMPRSDDAQNPSSDRNSPPSPSQSSPRDTAPEPYDEDRNQRWLAGQGLIRLRDFCNQNGTNKEHWPARDRGPDSILTHYATKLLQLQQPRKREFIVHYALPQGTSKEVGNLVEREIASLNSSQR